jgi:phosphonate transport system substrate-binding protein
MALLARNRALAAICVLASAALCGGEKPIIVGLVMDGATQEERAPLEAYLTNAVGQPINLVAPSTSRETVAHLGDGTYDFACLGALMYIRSHALYGVIPVVQRATDLHDVPVFITGTDSSIYSLSDLKGKQFAFGDIDSTSAHLMAYLTLKQAGINPDTELRLRFSWSHPETAALVATGVVDAGAIDKTVLDFLIRTGKLDSTKVRVFYTSDPYVDYVFVARKDVPKAAQEKFVSALLALKNGKDDRVLKILRAHKFVLASDEKYASTRQIAHETRDVLSRRAGLH